MSGTAVSIPGELYAQGGLRVTSLSSGPLVISGSADPSATPPSPSPPAGSIYMRTDTAELWQTDGTTWTRLGVGGSSQYLGAWSAGTYPAGSVVSHEGYLWMATEQTSLDILVPHGNLGSPTDWQGHTNGNSYGAYPTQSGDTIVLNDDSGNTPPPGVHVNAISTAEVSTSWNSKLYQFRSQIYGNGYSYQFGIFSGGANVAATDNGMIGISGFWGVILNLADGKVGAVVNGVVLSEKPQFHSFIISSSGATSGFVDWGMRLIDDGSTTTMQLFKGDQLVTYWPGITKPSFTTHRLAIGAWSAGGGWGQFKCNRVRSVPSTPAWVSLISITNNNQIWTTP